MQKANTVAVEKWSSTLNILPGLTLWGSRGTQKGNHIYFKGMTFIFAVPFHAFAAASLEAEGNSAVPPVTF